MAAGKRLDAVRQAVGMDLDEAIRTRRSIGRVKQDPIEKELIMELLEAAAWAPSHHNTQPWKFIVMTGEGRAKLGEGYAQVVAAMAKEAGAGDEGLADKLAKERMKAKRSPVVIAAVCSPSDDPRAIMEEEIAAANVAVQNLLLAAHVRGLGAVWRSGAPMYHPAMKEAFELKEQEQLVGLIYIGYPDMTAPEPKRTPVIEKTIWIEE